MSAEADRQRALIVSLVQAIEAGTTAERLDAVREARNWLDGGETRPTLAQVREAGLDWERAALATVALYDRWSYLSVGYTAGAAIVISQWEIDLGDAHETILRIVGERRGY